ncbi:MAG TPA: hypothetical protein DCZ94_17325 [Lentisphaeria bacterium]|nr:MAG: hypothetical protein A2X48_20855 [Lentisphaerae bacterium GWF2_49_21]HBC88707.1 hypothetical protein [Lentisphaeria bacterium]
MNENNDNTELKLRDAPLKIIELQKKDESSELKLQDAPASALELKKDGEPSELKLGDTPQLSPAPQVKKEKSLPLLVVKKDTPSKETEDESSVVIEQEVSSPEPEQSKSWNAVKTIFQVIVMLASVAAIIIAGYFIYKNLSPDAPPAPPKKEDAKNAKSKQAPAKDQKKTDKAPAKAPAPKKEAAKVNRIDANIASKENIARNFTELKMSKEDAEKMADEIIAGRPYKSLDELKGKYKEDKNKASIIGKAFSNFNNKPKAPAAPKTDKNASPAPAKEPDPAKTPVEKKEEAAPAAPPQE